MSKSHKITSFGAQSLHNSTGTIKNLRVSDPGPTAIPSLMLTVNATWYDVDGSNDSTEIPNALEVDVLLSGTGAGSFATLEGNLLALRSTKATLTGEDVNGTELTCTARCISIPTISTPTMFGAYTASYTVKFQKVTDWS